MPAEPWPSETTCPPWCNGVHDQTDSLPTSHRSDAWFVAAVERRPGSDGASFDRIATTELTVGVEQRWGDTWVWISPEDSVRRGLVLSRESAHRLYRTLAKIFEDLRP